MLRRASALTIVACLTLLLVPSTLAVDEVTLLDGVAIDGERAASLHCHDLEPAIVRCFTSNAAMLKDAARAAAERPGEGLQAMLAGYVVVYEHASWSGASRVLSQDYPDLGSIGWNDKISSLTSYGAIGRFREHNPPAGFIYSYNPSTDVSYVGAVYNDAFSTFEID